MNITKSMLEVFFVTDDDGEVVAGAFMYLSEAQEWIDENGGEDD